MIHLDFFGKREDPHPGKDEGQIPGKVADQGLFIRGSSMSTIPNKSQVRATPAPEIPKHMPTLMVAREKTESPSHKPASSLARYRYWHPNVHETTWVLTVDMDHPDSLMRYFEAVTAGLPQASWFIEKHENGHGQAGWIIEPVSHGPNSRIKPQIYARDVRQALTNSLDGDQAFTNARSWNPGWTGWPNHGEVFPGPMLPRSLGALRAPLVASGMWNPTPPAKVAQNAVGALRTSADSRNVAVFDYARLRAAGSVSAAAHVANASLSHPLSDSELRGIIRSIEKYEASHTRRTGGSGRMSDDQIKFQRAVGARGGAVNSDAQKAARAKGPDAASAVRAAEAIGRAATIRSLYEQGFSRAQIMTRMNVSRMTVFRALSE